VGPGDAFYLALVMDAASVLDVGCGRGALLHRARQAGHAGRLCGLDPDPAMLGVARRRRTDIEWVAGTAASMAFDGEFDLAIMTGHAFQVLVGDDEVRASLTAIRRALVDGGRFVFETRIRSHGRGSAGIRTTRWTSSTRRAGRSASDTRWNRPPATPRCGWTVPACASRTSTPSRASSLTPASRSTRSTEDGCGNH
jgi:SAM-dependent methyltransferase